MHSYTNTYTLKWRKQRSWRWFDIFSTHSSLNFNGTNSSSSSSQQSVLGRRKPIWFGQSGKSNQLTRASNQTSVSLSLAQLLATTTKIIRVCSTSKYLLDAGFFSLWPTKEQQAAKLFCLFGKKSILLRGNNVISHCETMVLLLHMISARLLCCTKAAHEEKIINCLLSLTLAALCVFDWNQT